MQEGLNLPYNLVVGCGPALVVFAIWMFLFGVVGFGGPSARCPMTNETMAITEHLLLTNASK